MKTILVLPVILIILAVALILLNRINLVGNGGGQISNLEIDSRFEISIFAKKLDAPRVIVFDPKGNLVVSETDSGKVVILSDTNSDGQADSEKILMDNLKSPHGLAFYTDPKTGKTYIYIAETHQVNRYEYDLENTEINKGSSRNIAIFPGGGRHFSRTIIFGPNLRREQIIKGYDLVNTSVPEKLYISVGSSCDVCLEDSWKRASILESDPDGNYTAQLASGLRNSVFFIFNPFTKTMWATEMGRDNLGDDLPPDEVNVIKPDLNYGWPFCYGKQVKDGTFNSAIPASSKLTSNCSLTQPPLIQIPAHSAPLGLAFVNSDRWPTDWQGNLLVAYHGSWNRNIPTGYKIVRYDINKNEKVSNQEAQDFISGWLADGKILGRPVDLKFGPDQALYISDDEVGIIYRVIPK
jgi:glucose/arabinose dehydrogenase